MKLLLITTFATALLWGGSGMADSYSTYPFTSSTEQQAMTDSDAVVSEDGVFLDNNPYGLMAEAENVAESYSNLPEQIPAQGERVFIFSPRLLRWAAYDADGYLVADGKANGGSSFCAELGRPCKTPTGSFRISRKGDSSCVSNRFPLGAGGAPMPYCMFFAGGNAIHGSPYISNRNTSHGCIRVYTQAAAWLSRYFLHPGTKVIVLPY